jgi:hypothetical protein
MPRPTIWTRLVALFLLWSGLRSVWFLLLADTNPSFRLARDIGFGTGLQFGEILYALVGLTAAAAIWWRWKGGVQLGTGALAIYAALILTGLQQMRDNPAAARKAYAESQETRGLSVREEQLDTIFSPSGQAVAWGGAAVVCLTPLLILWWRKEEFPESP